MRHTMPDRPENATGCPAFIRNTDSSHIEEGGRSIIKIVAIRPAVSARGHVNNLAAVVLLDEPRQRVEFLLREAKLGWRFVGQTYRSLAHAAVSINFAATHPIEL